MNGYGWDDIVKQTWYQTGVDTRWRDMVNEQEKVLQSAMDSVVGGAGKVGGRCGQRLNGVGGMAFLIGMGVLGVILL